MRARLIPAALAAAVLAMPATAGAVTFGADLDQRTANSTATCGYPPYDPGYYMGDSCTFFSTATPTGQASETQVVPLPDPAVHGNQAGTITQVRIKTGPYQAGPAKLTVLRAQRAAGGGEAPCCVGHAESSQFTLTPNSIVHVNTNLPVESKYDAAQRIYTYDILALSVLDATTPIPGEFSGDPMGYCSTAYFPYVQTEQERFSGDYGICGFLVLMQADMTIHKDDPDPDTPPVTQDDGGGTVTPTLTMPTRGRIVGRTARIPIDCAGDALCEGVLRLQNAPAPGAAAAAKKQVTYGKRKFKIPAGTRKTVKVKLSKRGRKLVRRRKAVRVYVNAMPTTGKAFTKKIKLKIS